MKAVVQDSYGSADVLEVRDLDKPTPTDDEVLVRVRAAGVDPGVWHLMTGRPWPPRSWKAKSIICWAATRLPGAPTSRRLAG
jgi:NADPH:quinone reductase-like Zn-dependent oxidoreductase